MKNSLPEIRRKKLKELLATKKSIRVMETSNGLTGLICENAKYVDADYTLGMNGITENSVIICKRQKQEISKSDKENKLDREGFTYEPKIKNAE